MQLVTGALRIYAAPKLRRSTGLPAFTLIGHDVEEFIGVVRRYSVAAAGVQAMIDAAAQGRHRFRVR
jgi:putative metallopeptidase